MIRRRSIAVFVCALLLTASLAAARTTFTAPIAATLQSTVDALTTAEMDGRRSGTPGGDLAARRLAEWLAAAGLRPGGDDGTFLQSFVLSRGTRLAAESMLELTAPTPRTLAPGRDWMPHGGSMLDTVSGEIVFVGHAVVAPEAGYDDFAGVDVRGRIAVALDGAPAHLAVRSTRLDKLIAARHRGARALLVVSETLPTLPATGVAFELVSAAVTPAAADALLAGTGKTVSALGAAIADRRAPVSFATATSARLRVALESADRLAVNVIGVLPGTDAALAREAVVLGAHYDHLGRSGDSVHHGADDNASGTAVVLGLARSFAAAGGTGRTLVFAFFGAEELGLIGSGHYVRQPTVPLDRTVAMLNFDMVGRLRDGRLTVGGVDTGSGLRKAVAEAARADGVAVELRAGSHAASDHARFYSENTPVLFFHTGTHRDYHQPSDTAEKIDADGMARVAAVGARVTQRLAAGDRPAFAKVAPPAERGRRRAVSATGAFFGIAGDGRAEADGLHLSQVIAGSAAARAGLRDGDVIVRFAGTPVQRVEDVRAVLKDKRPGDRVHVVYLRDGKDHATSATLDPPKEP